MLSESANSLEQSAESFLQLIYDELAAWYELKDTLVEELNILIKKDVYVLSKLTNKKEQQCSALESKGLEREKFLKDLSFTNNKEGINTFLLSLPIDNQEEIRPVWEQLQTIAMECKTANEVNGQLIDRSQKTTHWLLNLFRGKHLTPKLYGADGSTSEQGEKLKIAQA